MQRYFAKEKKDAFFVLNQDDLYHIKTVMRMQIGDLVEVVYDRKLYLASIVKMDDEVVLQIKEEILVEDALPQVVIAQSLVKEQKMDFILQKAVELGVSSIIPVMTTRSIVKLDSKIDKKMERWQRIMKEASEQSKRIVIPRIEKPLSIKELSELSFDIKILCTVNEMSRSVKRVLSNVKKDDKIIIVIGPEGGFTNEEEEVLVKNGFLPVTLGDTVLRTETASLCVLSMIRYHFMR